MKYSSQIMTTQLAEKAFNGKKLKYTSPVQRPKDFMSMAETLVKMHSGTSVTLDKVLDNYTAEMTALTSFERSFLQDYNNALDDSVDYANTHLDLFVRNGFVFLADTAAPAIFRGVDGSIDVIAVAGPALIGAMLRVGRVGTAMVPYAATGAGVVMNLAPYVSRMLRETGNFFRFTFDQLGRLTGIIPYNGNDGDGGGDNDGENDGDNVPRLMPPAPPEDPPANEQVEPPEDEPFAMSNVAINLAGPAVRAAVDSLRRSPRERTQRSVFNEDTSGGRNR
jgi:hypothetical protein